MSHRTPDEDPAPSSQPRPSCSIDASPLRLWIETIAVTACVLVPWLAAAITRVLSERKLDVNDYRPFTALDLIGNIGTAAIPLCFIKLSQESWKGFGITRFHLGSDFGAGLALFLVAEVADYTMAILMGHPTAYRSEATLTQGTALSFGLGVLTITINSFTQELVFRAWLLTRLRTLAKSLPLAVFVSSLLFASYHIHQGSSAIPRLTIIGVLFCLAFAVTRCIWPCVIAHSLHNLLIAWR